MHHRRHDAGERRGKMQIRPLRLDLQGAVNGVLCAHVDLLEAVGGPRAIVIVEPGPGPSPAWPGTARSRGRRRRPRDETHRVEDTQGVLRIDPRVADGTEDRRGVRATPRHGGGGRLRHGEREGGGRRHVARERRSWPGDAAGIAIALLAGRAGDEVGMVAEAPVTMVSRGACVTVVARRSGGS